MSIETEETRWSNVSTARDIMTPNPEWIREDEDLHTAARRMADLDVGSLPICGPDDRLSGMVTDRDIVTQVVAQGLDPRQVAAGSIARGRPITVSVDDDMERILRVMAENQIRRLPVLDGQQLVGIIAVADVARALPERPVGDLLEALSVG